MAGLAQNFKKFVKPCVPLFVAEAHARRKEHDLMRQAGVEPQYAALNLPERSIYELLPGMENVEVTLPVSQFYRPSNMVLPVVETLTISAICRYRQPKSVFEIGTYLGNTTRAIADAVPDACRIFTLDLDDAALHRIGLKYDIGISFRDSVNNRKITQLRGDSRNFDFSPYLDQMDLVFVDADHSYPCVKADTETAFRLLAPGGMIIWDDYVWGEHPDCVGVAHCLNELSRSTPIFHISGTRLATYIDTQGTEPGSHRS